MSDENKQPEDSEPKLASEAEAAKEEPKEGPVDAPRTGDPVADGDVSPPVDAAEAPPVEAEQPAELIVAPVQPEAAPVEASQPEAAPVEAPPVSTAELDQILASVPQPEWIGLDADADRPFDAEKWPEDMSKPDEAGYEPPRRPELLQTVEAGTGVAVMNDVLVGRIPSREYSITRSFRWDGQNGTTPAYADVDAKMGYHTLTGAANAGVIEVPYTGRITGFTLNYIEDTGAGHTAGNGQFRLINVTTTETTDATVVLASEDEDAVMDTQAVAVTADDAVFIQGKWLTGGPCVYVRAEVVVTVFFEEQSAYVVTGAITPDATGVYVRNGQLNGNPAFERIDGKYWIFYEDAMSGWWITAALGDTAGLGWASGGGGLVAAYGPGGGASGTATVAAQAD